MVFGADPWGTAREKMEAFGADPCGQPPPRGLRPPQQGMAARSHSALSKIILSPREGDCWGNLVFAADP